MVKMSSIKGFRQTAVVTIIGASLMGFFSSSKATDAEKTLFNQGFSFKTLMGGKELSLSQFQGKVVMIVNTASQCGFTRQYEALEKIYNQYKDQGFVIIGVPSNDNGGQEPGSNEEIANFCKISYGVTFPMTQKEGVVAGNKDCHPVFNWAYEVNGFGSAVKWNFQKYLFDRKGNASTYYYSSTAPDSSSITNQIEKLLAEK